MGPPLPRGGPLPMEPLPMGPPLPRGGPLPMEPLPMGPPLPRGGPLPMEPLPMGPPLPRGGPLPMEPLPMGDTAGGLMVDEPLPPPLPIEPLPMGPVAGGLIVDGPPLPAGAEDDPPDPAVGAEGGPTGAWGGAPPADEPLLGVATRVALSSPQPTRAITRETPTSQWGKRGMGEYLAFRSGFDAKGRQPSLCHLSPALSRNTGCQRARQLPQNCKFCTQCAHRFGPCRAAHRD